MWTDYHRADAVADGPQGAVFIAVDAEGRAIGNPWMHSYGGDEACEAMKKHHGMVQSNFIGDLVFALQERDAGR